MERDIIPIVTIVKCLILLILVLMSLAVERKDNLWHSTPKIQMWVESVIRACLEQGVAQSYLLAIEWIEY